MHKRKYKVHTALSKHHATTSTLNKNENRGKGIKNKAKTKAKAQACTTATRTESPNYEQRKRGPQQRSNPEVGLLAPPVGGTTAQA